MFRFQMTHRGEAHAFNGLACQDAVATHRHNDVVCCTLADGVSACRYGGEAARELADMMAILFATNFDVYLSRDDDALRDEVAEMIRSEQARLAYRLARGGEYVLAADMGCTLALAAYNKRTGQHIAINLGDGAVLARRSGHDAAEMLLPPVRVSIDGALLPVVTAYDVPLIRENIAISRGTRQYDSFLLSSDGLEGVLFDGQTGAISPSVSELMHNMVVDPCGTNLFFPQAIAALHCMDDVSLNAIVHRPPVEDTFIDYRRPLVPGGVRRKARQLAEYGEAIYMGHSRKDACSKAGIRYRNKLDWRKTQARLRAVGLDD